MGFKRPTRASSDGETEYFQLKNFQGEAALFKVNDEDEEYVNPRFEKDDPRPYVWADVTIVTGDGAGKFFPNAEIGGKHVWEALKDAAGTGDLILGRIVRGDKGGRPYFINDPFDGDEELAEGLLAGATAGSVAASDVNPEQESGDDGKMPWE